MARAPHCDGNVLHAPGECDYCDLPEFAPLHEARRAGRINYTGHTDPGMLHACPSEKKRSLKIIEMWYGNVPSKTRTRDK